MAKTMARRDRHAHTHTHTHTPLAGAIEKQQCKNLNWEVRLFASRFAFPIQGKVQFNYVFVHVHSPQAGPRNLNGNRRPIHLFFYFLFFFILLSLPIGTVAAY